MSSYQKRRLKRRRRISRSARKTLINLLFAPLRMPKMTAGLVAFLMKICEGCALLFVFLLVIHMAAPEVVATGLVIFAGIVFVGLLGVVKFSDYQEKIEQYKYYGFRI